MGSSQADPILSGQARPGVHPAVCRLFILFIKMIGKVRKDSFQGLRIQIGSPWEQSEPLGQNSPVVSPSSLLGDSLSRLDKECPVGWGRPHSSSHSQTSSQIPQTLPLLTKVVSSLLDIKLKCVALSKNTELASMETNANLLTALMRFVT